MSAVTQHNPQTKLLLSPDAANEIRAGRGVAMRPEFYVLVPQASGEAVTA